jgi:hypothetical protein
MLIPLTGGAIAVAGVDKLTGARGYRRMFAHLGWSESQMQAAAVAETVGGLLMVPPATRRLGGALVAGVSSLVLLSELSEGEVKLAAPRSLVLLAGLAALFGA